MAAVAGVTGVCRSCGAHGLQTFLSLGETPLADALVAPERLGEPEARYPLDVAFCAACSLVQILEEVAPQVLFVENYLYFSSFSDALIRHAREHADALVAGRGLGAESLVVEIGSNDGYLLQGFAEHGVGVLGIDPAPDQAALAAQRGIPTLTEFFGLDVARRLAGEGRRADVVIANNVMAHTPHLNDFVAGLAVLLADDGVATIENPYVRDLIEHVEFDTVYHEHFSYFSCTAVDTLVRRHGLVLQAVEHFPALHGGTLRWTVGRDEAQVRESARRFLAAERDQGIVEPAYYERFGARVGQIQEELLALLRRLKREGASIAAYGAAAKGATLLNATGIGTDLLDFVVDRNTHKQGLHMPGVHVPIVAPSALLERRPDYVLLLAWNFRDEVLAQQEAYRAGGGRFVVPIPAPEIV